MRGRPKNVGRLTQVRLSDVDVTIRRRAARLAVAERLDEVARPEDRLLARLFDRPGDDELDALRHAAEHPSDRAYWLPAEAVRRVLGDA